MIAAVWTGRNSMVRMLVNEFHADVNAVSEVGIYIEIMLSKLIIRLFFRMAGLHSCTLVKGGLSKLREHCSLSLMWMSTIDPRYGHRL